ncbi:class I tRNA ligase family protein [Candidatus Wolfebacteria bacterium]|nr:class I tRNA ligase family protein [Candidatus Wolfebacteria bacterium]
MDAESHKSEATERTVAAKKPAFAKAVAGKSALAEREERILAFWQENNIFEKSLAKPSPKGEFVFYEGPPTANGRPGIHHVEARAFKDIIPRYKTMCGYHVRRKGGWDTHGLPVELEVEKELGFKTKKDIETYGIAAFNQKCRESVWKYKEEWERFTTRIGYWLDLEHSYITYETNYIESLWYIIKRVAKKNLLYKDYKVVPWCPRCGTALSSHELAQGYADVEDTSVYVKFRVKNPERVGLSGDVYLLAWTTTPWTLLGNVALAVGKNVEYVKLQILDPEKSKKGERKIINLILSNDIYLKLYDADIKNPLKIALGLAHTHSEELHDIQKTLGYLKGEELIGLEYEPLFPYLADSLPESEKIKLDNAFKVYAADFVSTEEGAGIVHTAVMYGQDDFELGTKIGLPKHHLVDEEGKFTKDTGEFSGMFVKDADTAIIAALTRQNLFTEEKITHTYPFCWRCKTPLIYYARDSWYIAMSKLRDKLIKENQKIHWEPTHIRDGRFGEWLREVKDWAISRNRYWGTPLPVWKCTDCGGTKVIGSIAELRKHTKTSGNTYFVMRHGQSEGNTKGTVNYLPEVSDGLTDVGRAEVARTLKHLRPGTIDVIITSPLQRTRETAEMVREYLGLGADGVLVDERLGEVRVGEFQGLTWGEYHDTYTLEEQFVTAPEGGETRTEVKHRAGELLHEIEERYQGKSILLISHEGVIELFYAVIEGADAKRSAEIISGRSIPNAHLEKLSFVPLPHNANYEVDLHRPYIDDIALVCECDSVMERVPEVMDVWFDSGAVPFAQDHYPFENKRWVDSKGYPADYISEGLDMTRGWFYTLHAVGILAKGKRAFQNVIAVGLLNDASGKKMSKSVGNVVDPWKMLEKYGADVLRYWMYTINQPGESKNFDERTVDEVAKRVFGILENVTKFYELYADTDIMPGIESNNVLDRWILARLGMLIGNITGNLDALKVLEPARAIRDFVTDLSTWYIRRSRDRFKGDDEKDKQAALATTRFVLLELAKVMAPFTPFIAEDIYQRVKAQHDTNPRMDANDTNEKWKESVHLEAWPRAGKPDVKVLADMTEVRRVVSLALESRMTAGIKVRQPLATLKIRNPKSEIRNNEGLLQLIRDEVNVKKVVFEDATGWEVELDTTLTSELKAEGQARELIRAVQNLRKEAGLSPSDAVVLEVDADVAGRALIEKFKNEIQRTALLRDIRFVKVIGTETTIDNVSFTLALKK